MADYKNLTEMLSSTDNLTYVRQNSRMDDGTDKINGVDWFKFNGNTFSQIYISSNGYIGFGSDTHHLNVNQRDMADWNVGYETGKVGLGMTYKYLRIYWDGTSAYSSSYHGNIAYTLVFDVVLLDTNDIYLNIETYPTSSNNGTNSLVSSTTVTYAPSQEAKQFTFRHQDADGKVFTVENGLNEPLYATIRYLLGDDTKVYTVADDALSEVTEPLTASVFQDKGLTAIPSDIAKGIANLKVYKWQDRGENNFSLELTATPHKQAVESTADLSSSTIKGISKLESEYTGDVTAQYSYDGTTYTNEQSMTDFLATDVKALYNGLTDVKKIYFKFWLNSATDTLTSFKMTYIN